MFDRVQPKRSGGLFDWRWSEANTQGGERPIRYTIPAVPYGKTRRGIPFREELFSLCGLKAQSKIRQQRTDHKNLHHFFFAGRGPDWLGFDVIVTIFVDQHELQLFTRRPKRCCHTFCIPDPKKGGRYVNLNNTYANCESVHVRTSGSQVGGPRQSLGASLTFDTQKNLTTSRICNLMSCESTVVLKSIVFRSFKVGKKKERAVFIVISTSPNARE